MTGRPSPTGAAASALGLTGVGVLIASTIAELSDLHPRAELTTGAGAGAAFLVAMALSRGGDPQVLDRRGRLLVGAGLAALLAVAALWQITEYAAPRVLLLLIPVALLFSTAGLAVREAAVQRRRAHLRELRARLDGEEAERRRWVRELHDDTLQELAAVMVVLGAADVPGRAITEARELVGRQIQTLRRLIAQMRPLALDSLGLTAALEDLGQHAHDATGIDIEVVSEPLPRLPTDTETALYRVVQEALTNAVRHSGAGHIAIRTATRPGEVLVSVADNGCVRPVAGFTAGHGITGMRERADALGAQLEIVDRPGGGTEVRLSMPLRGDAELPAQLR
jgi:signal transduction histidine kinase